MPKWVKPLLSIITVTYKAPEALAATLASLEALRHESFDWEHVIVDSSPEINSALLPGSSGRRTVRHVVQPPAGIYAAMNAGIDAAQGDFLWFLNGGDRLASAEALRKSLRELDAHPSRLFAQAAAGLYRDDRLLYVQRPRAGLLPHLGINRVCHQAMLYRRGFFTNVGRYSEKLRIAADYELHLRAIALGHDPLLVNEVIAHYDMGGQSSNVEAALEEFGQVHDALAAEGKLPNRMLHALAHKWERARIDMLKNVDRTPFGESLRAAWHWIRRSV